MYLWPLSVSGQSELHVRVFNRASGDCRPLHLSLSLSLFLCCVALKDAKAWHWQRLGPAEGLCSCACIAIKLERVSVISTDSAMLVVFVVVINLYLYVCSGSPYLSLFAVLPCRTTKEEAQRSFNQVNSDTLRSLCTSSVVRRVVAILFSR